MIHLGTVREVKGKKAIKLKDILASYWEERGPYDLICFIMLFIDVIGDYEAMNYLRLLIYLKVGIVIDNFEYLKNIFIDSFYKEQYWNLAKIFFINFFFAHLLCILLLAMARLTPNNWLVEINANKAPWY